MARVDNMIRFYEIVTNIKINNCEKTYFDEDDCVWTRCGECDNCFILNDYGEWRLNEVITRHPLRNEIKDKIELQIACEEYKNISNNLIADIMKTIVDKYLEEEKEVENYDDY